MPGFFESMGRLFKGEPVFNAEDGGNKIVQRAGDPTQSSPTAPVGPKILPQVMISRWECREQGAGLHCEIMIRNFSQGGVTLDKIELLNVRDELGEHLEPGEEYEYQFNLPNRPRDTHEDECKLYFKNAAGDYFCSVHQIEFEQQADNTYSILRFRFIPPVRDV